MPLQLLAGSNKKALEPSIVPGSRQRGGTMMKTNKTVATLAVVGLFLIAAVAWAAGDEQTITGVISGVNPTTRIATVTPASGPPIVVQFAFNAGGPCNSLSWVGPVRTHVRRNRHRGLDVDAHLHDRQSRRVRPHGSRVAPLTRCTGQWR